MPETIRAVDLFCGAGGLSWGLVQALREVALNADAPTEAFLAEAIDLVGVDHWDQAIETHQRNHPWARHFHDDVANVNPRDVFDERDPEVTIVSGGIECTHWSTARGGKPVSEQKRMPAWDFLNWVQKLRPGHVLVENVPEFESWGPIVDGEPTRNGDTFASWVDSLHSLGYSVDWGVLDAADYGDATARERLFVLATRDGTPQFPDPTHSDECDDLPDRRSAAEIIDWSDPGGSIWTRDLDDPRKRPLKNSTMQRIGEGIRRHCDGRLEPFADVLAEIGRDDVRRLREQPVPVRYAATAARVLEEPFLVACDGTATPATPSLTKYYSTSSARPVDAPLDTTTSGGLKYGLCVPQVLGQHSNSVARDATARPAPTIAAAGKLQLVTQRAYLLRQQSGGVPPAVDEPLPTIGTEKGGVFALSAPYLCPLYNGRDEQRPRTRSVDRPLMTVPASKSPAGVASPLAQPFLDDYEGSPNGLDTPLGTITAIDKFTLVIPELYPWALDVRYRMLQPRELQRAQGFPDDYEITGTKRDTTRQIGNAVPVTLAQRLVESLLADRLPSLTDYLGDGTTAGGVASDA